MNAAAMLVAARNYMAEFEREFLEMCLALKETGLAAAVCTVYEPRVAADGLQKISAMAVSATNGAIESCVKQTDLHLIRLQNAKMTEEDFADPIHPSPSGAQKIAELICRTLRKP